MVRGWPQISCGISQSHLVARNDATPETNITPHASLNGRRTFLLKVVDGRSGWNGVEWHIDKSGHTAGDSSGGTSRESLPVSSTRLVQMDMGTGFSALRKALTRPALESRPYPQLVL